MSVTSVVGSERQRQHSCDGVQEAVVTALPCRQHDDLGLMLLATASVTLGITAAACLLHQSPAVAAFSPPAAFLAPSLAPGLMACFLYRRLDSRLDDSRNTHCWCSSCHQPAGGSQVTAFVLA